MLDTLLVVEGESAQDFHLAVTVDDDLPHISQQDWLTPAIVVSVEQGPPVAGPSSWLFHLDAPSVLLLDLQIDPVHSSSLIARFAETFGYATQAQLRCPRNPLAACTVDGWGKQELSQTIGDDAVSLHLGCYELQNVKIDF